MQAYCLKCRTKRDMEDAKSITMKNGKSATQGICPECGTKMFKIGKSSKREVRVVTKAARKSWLADVPQDKMFRCHDGRVIKNMEELSVSLREISEETFRYHITEDRNDFSRWVQDVIGDYELSTGLQNSSAKDQAAKVVADRIARLKGQVGKNVS
jgi:predicted  nucleic acid-binding Zn-ribbon protein